MPWGDFTKRGPYDEAAPPPWSPLLTLAVEEKVYDLDQAAASGEFSSGATTLDELSDVAVSTAQAGQLLQYDGVNWIGGVIPAHEHAGENITSGTISVARIGTGIKDTTTFLRGDNTFAVPPGTGGGSSTTNYLYGTSAVLAGQTSVTVTTTYAGPVADIRPTVLKTSDGGVDGADLILTAKTSDEPSDTTTFTLTIDGPTPVSDLTFEWYIGLALSASSGIEPVSTMATLEATTGTSGETRFLLSHSVLGDGGEGYFRWDASAARAFSATAADNTFTATAHGFKRGDKVRLYGASLPSGTDTVTTYYVTNVTPNTFQLAANFPNAVQRAGTLTVIDLTTDGSGEINYAHNGGTIIVPTGNPSSGRWMRMYTGDLYPEWFGARGDGTDDAPALNNAVEAARAKARVMLAKEYWIAAPIYGANHLSLASTDRLYTAIRALPGFTGGLIELHANSSLTLEDIIGYGLDGVDGIYFCSRYGAGGSYSAFSLKNISFYNVEYGFLFDRASEFPLLVQIENVFGYNVRTCGAIFATGGTEDSGQTETPTSGQSAFLLEQIVITNGNQPSADGISASAVTVTADSPNTSTDTVSWSSTGATQFGWVIMRRPAGSVDPYAWRHITYAGRTDTSYQAAKTAGETFEYTVLRASHGVYVRHVKVITANTLQCEDVAVGAKFRQVTALTVNGFYDECPQVEGSPVPIGDGIYLNECVVTNIHSVWSESILSGVNSHYNNTVNVDGIYASSCQRSCFHLQSWNSGQPVKVENTVAYLTPERISTDGSAFSSHVLANMFGVADADTDLENRYVVNHYDKATFTASLQGDSRAQVGADSSGGFLWAKNSSLPTASSTYEGQIRYSGGTFYGCRWNGSSYVWQAL